MLDHLSRALRGALVVSCLWAGDSLTRQNQLRGADRLFPEVVRKSTSDAVPSLPVDPKMALDLEIRPALQAQLLNLDRAEFGL